jgi:TRAP-type mannitol/chloroaromatic compound transport system permease small subunit
LRRREFRQRRISKKEAALTLLLRLSRAIDLVTAFFGRSIAWMILAAVLVSAGNAVIRKLFDMSSNGWLELQWYLFGAVFMLGAAYTLQRNEHIRIDIVSGLFTERTRQWIDVVGHLFFLLPLTFVMTWEMLPWVRRAIVSGEMSGNAGGLILWPARLCLLVGFVLLLFQGISELIKTVARLRGLLADSTQAHSAARILVE